MTLKLKEVLDIGDGDVVAVFSDGKQEVRVSEAKETYEKIPEAKREAHLLGIVKHRHSLE